VRVMTFSRAEGRGPLILAALVLALVVGSFVVDHAFRIGYRAGYSRGVADALEAGGLPVKGGGR
jgi:hypothetical protein